MKKLMLLTAIISSILACSSSKKGETSDKNKFNLDTTKLTAGTSYYQCPMHPEVMSKVAGDCPKCGMALQEVKKY
jgi:hypothetical protein